MSSSAWRVRPSRHPGEHGLEGGPAIPVGGMGWGVDVQARVAETRRARGGVRRPCCPRRGSAAAGTWPPGLAIDHHGLA